jgi:hypothetical protein
LGTSMLGKQIESVNFVVTNLALIYHQWMGYSESTKYR